MKILTLWAEATVKPAFVLLAMIAILMTGTSAAWAYEQYSTSIDRNSGNCADCHGNFRTDPYDPPSGGTNWTDSLHDIHRFDMLGGDCDTCHMSSGRYPTFLDNSAGGTGLTTISCVGCHGRNEDIGNDSESAGRGAGLRQHHTRAGEPDCTDCHSDAVLASYTPVFESVLPNYYANPGTDHPAMPTNSCVAVGGENFAGSATGLDNDGNGEYDGADSNCLIPVELMIFEIE